MLRTDLPVIELNTKIVEIKSSEAVLQIRRDIEDNFPYLSVKTYIVTPH